MLFFRFRGFRGFACGLNRLAHGLDGRGRGLDGRNLRLCRLLRGLLLVALAADEAADAEGREDQRTDQILDKGRLFKRVDIVAVLDRMIAVEQAAHGVPRTSVSFTFA